MNGVKQSTIRLSQREAVYLKNTSFLPDALAQIVKAASDRDDHGLTISLPNAMSEEFRAAFTEQLAKVGFDSEYEPTAEGKLLEGLIDRFQLK